MYIEVGPHSCEDLGRVNVNLHLVVCVGFINPVGDVIVTKHVEAG
jgi:hypothetical protein